MAIDEVIAKFKYPVQSFRSCFGILNYAKRYSKEALENCCRDALLNNRCNYTYISNNIASYYIPPSKENKVVNDVKEKPTGKYKDDDSSYSLDSLLKAQEVKLHE